MKNATIKMQIILLLITFAGCEQTGLVDPPSEQTGLVEPSKGGNNQVFEMKYKDGIKRLQRVSLNDFSNLSQYSHTRIEGDLAKTIQTKINNQLKTQNAKMDVSKVHLDRMGNTHIRLQQHYRDLPVIGSDIAVHVDTNNIITSVNGKWDPSLEIDVTAELSEEKAVTIAAQVVRMTLNKDIYKESKLVIFNGDLAYQITLAGSDITSSDQWRVYINAKTGEFLFKESLMYNEVPTPIGTVNSPSPTDIGETTSITGSRMDRFGGGQATVNGWLDDNGSYYLYGKEESWIIFNDNLRGYSFRSTSDWADSNPIEMSAAENIAMVQNYASEVLNIDSYNGSGSVLPLYVDIPNENNAGWTAVYNACIFGNGDGVLYDPFVSLDTVAHEFGHAITSYSSNLIYQNEPGALNESYSDIFATLVEFFSQPDGGSNYPDSQTATADWLIGEEVAVSADALRDMRNPKRFGQPSFYHGENWYSDVGDYGGVHYNSGVQNFAFYLLAEGGQGENDSVLYDMDGIGIEAAGHIAMYADMYYMTSSSEYVDSRMAWISAGYALGYDETVINEIKEAWDAVGVSDAFKSLTVSPGMLNFGNVPVGVTQRGNLNLSNQGNAITTIYNIRISSPTFSTDADLPIMIHPGGTVTIHVDVTPQYVGDAFASIEINSTADDYPMNAAALLVEGVDPPSIDITPQSVDVSVSAGQTVSKSLTIANNGNGLLQWSILGLANSDSVQQSENNVLIVENPGDMFKLDENLQVLTALGANISTATIEELVLLELSDYESVVLEEGQNSDFYNALPSVNDKLEEYVKEGGNLQMHMMSWPNTSPLLSLPGGLEMGKNNGFQMIENVLKPEHPMMENFPGPVIDANDGGGLTLGYTYFENVPDNADIITTEINNNPTTVEYKLGAGIVLATTLAIELHRYAGDQGLIGSMLESALSYSMDVHGYVPWISCANNAGSVQPGDSQIVELTIDAQELESGIYEHMLIVKNNSITGDINIPVTVTVHEGFPCNDTNSIDLGYHGYTTGPVSTDSCLKITQFPNWWNTHTLQLQPKDGNSYSIPFAWSNCENTGTGTFYYNWQNIFIKNISEDCPMFIDLNGQSSGSVKMTWW